MQTWVALEIQLWALVVNILRHHYTTKFKNHPIFRSSSNIRDWQHWIEWIYWSIQTFISVPSTTSPSFFSGCTNNRWRCRTRDCNGCLYTSNYIENSGGQLQISHREHCIPEPSVEMYWEGNIRSKKQSAHRNSSGYYPVWRICCPALSNSDYCITFSFFLSTWFFPV